MWRGRFCRLRRRHRQRRQGHDQPAHEVGNERRKRRNQRGHYPDQTDDGRIHSQIFGHASAHAGNLGIHARAHQSFLNGRRAWRCNILPGSAEVAKVRIIGDVSLAIAAIHFHSLPRRSAPHWRHLVPALPIDTNASPPKVPSKSSVQYAPSSRTARTMSSLCGKIASSSCGW
jgi:hypothetical protein